MTPLETDAIARRINRANARRSARAEAAAHIVLAVVLGIIGAALLVHYMTPCDAGHLCALAAITRTRQPLWRRAAAAAHAAYLRCLIRSAQATLRYQQEAQLRAQGELDYLPHAQAVTRQHIAALQVRLMSL
jgi:hypothetical protein